LVGVIVFTHWILWSESGAGHFFYPGSTSTLKPILWDDCELKLLNARCLFLDTIKASR
jgi:hypothetical protein